MKKAIETIEEVMALIEAEKEQVRKIDAENLSLSVLESGKTLYEQNERLRAITVALNAVAGEETKKALNSEINSLQYSIKNLNRIDELSRARVEHISILKGYSEKLVNSFELYKEKKLAFERRIGAISGVAMELMKSEEEGLSDSSLPEKREQSAAIIPSEAPIMSGVSKKTSTTAEENSLEEIFKPKKNTLFKPDTIPAVEYAVSSETNNDADFEPTEEEEKASETVEACSASAAPVKLNPIFAISKILRRFENLTSQLDSEKYNKRLYNTFKEVLIEEPEKEAICKMFDTGKCAGLTDEQTKVIILSMPKEIITALGRKDILEMRKTAAEAVYSKGFLNTECRPFFTYKLIGQLSSLILSDTENKELKIKVLFNENSDKIIKTKYGKESPDYRAFAVLKEEDLLNY